jgi:hypothetical protein
MINFLHSMAIVTYVTFAISGVLPQSLCSPMIGIIHVYRPYYIAISEWWIASNVK